jgi:hypothetical protein
MIITETKEKKRINIFFQSNFSFRLQLAQVTVTRSSIKFYSGTGLVILIYSPMNDSPILLCSFELFLHKDLYRLKGSSCICCCIHTYIHTYMLLCVYIYLLFDFNSFFFVVMNREARSISTIYRIN